MEHMQACSRRVSCCGLDASHAPQNARFQVSFAPSLPCSFNAYCPPQFLAWQYRCPRLLAELESYAADLLFLQEVESTVFDQQLQPWMQQRGYSSLFHPRRSPQGAAVEPLNLQLPGYAAGGSISG
jgi:hypothetical protein